MNHLMPCPSNKRIGSATTKATWVLCLGLWSVLIGPLRADNIDDELWKQAPIILKHLEEQGCNNVGVLSFMLKKGNAPSTFGGGLICEQLPGRLASALILRHRPDAPDLFIARNASNHAAANIASAGYRTSVQRRRLFDLKYPLAWSGPDVAPDIFLAGRVSLSPDFRMTNISIGAFERQNPGRVYDLVEFDVPTDRHILADAGEGFSLSKGKRKFVRGFSDDEIIASVGDDTKEKTADLVDKKVSGKKWANGFPVTLTIRYDGVEQTLEPDLSASGRNNFVVDGPKEGEVVTFGVKNDTGDPLGIVLRVNQISTLYEKFGDESTLPKWVLAPGKQYEIKGYHREDKETFVKIVGLSEELSKAVFEDLGGDKYAGKIHLYVYRSVDQDSGKAPGFSKEIAVLDEDGSTRANLRTFGDLQQDLLKKSVLGPGDIRSLMSYSPDEGKETLEKDELGAVEHTDTMIVEYYKKPEDY